MRKNNERLDHGNHNEKVCDYLDLKKEFSDWIITTAFYSALQFVSYKIFPFQMPSIGGKSTTINNIDDFNRYNNKKNISKHELLADLVDKHCNKISEDYHWLLDMSMTARYNNYHQDELIANKARGLMKKIKSFCV